MLVPWATEQAAGHVFDNTQQPGQALDLCVRVHSGVHLRSLWYLSSSIPARRRSDCMLAHNLDEPGLHNRARTTAGLHRGSEPGSGLGLTVVQSIVDDHGGYIDLRSEAGTGTTFTIYLPISREGLTSEEPPVATGGSEAVLVVDDDEIQRFVTKQLLEALGYEVTTVASGEAAIEYLRERPADLLILDMIMPGGIDGAETYRRVLEIRPAQPAIIVSGFVESDRVHEAQALGAGAYVRKPLTLEGLAQAVRHELERESPLPV